jgi:type VI secretion system secreted protein Hcp
MSRVIGWVVAASLLSLGSAAHAATVDAFLRIDGIPGESTVKGYEKWIQLRSYDLGIAQAGAKAASGGGGAGKATFSDAKMTKHIDKSSLALFQAAAVGNHIKKAELAVRRAGNQQEFYRCTFEDVLVTQFQQGANDAADSLPVEQLSLNYAKIRCEYRPMRADGSLEAPVKMGYDVKAGRADTGPAPATTTRAVVPVRTMTPFRRR